jgi:DNA-binding transcriptional LysR family regulator
MPRRVHTISSISAMTQLVEAGFGIATLPRAAIERMLTHRELGVLRCAQGLQPLPVFASHRADPLSREVEAVVGSVFEFLAAGPGRAAATSALRRARPA